MTPVVVIPVAPPGKVIGVELVDVKEVAVILVGIVTPVAFEDATVIAPKLAPPPIAPEKVVVPVPESVEKVCVPSTVELKVIVAPVCIVIALVPVSKTGLFIVIAEAFVVMLLLMRIWAAVALIVPKGVVPTAPVKTVLAAPEFVVSV